MRVADVETALRHVPFFDRAAITAPNGAREHAGNILGQAHRLTDLADRHARTIVDHRGAKARTVAAVLLIDVLDHLLAPLMLEIDINVGRLVAVLGNETLKQQRMLDRVDRSDAQAKAHRRIGRRTASLAQDRRLAAACEIDDVLDGEKVLRELLLADQGQFLAQRLGHAVRHPGGIVLPCPFPGQPFQIGLGIQPIGIGLAGIFIAQLIQAELAGIGQFP